MSMYDAARAHAQKSIRWEVHGALQGALPERRFHLTANPNSCICLPVADGKKQRSDFSHMTIHQQVG